MKNIKTCKSDTIILMFYVLVLEDFETLSLNFQFKLILPTSFSPLANLQATTVVLWLIHQKGHLRLLPHHPRAVHMMAPRRREAAGKWPQKRLASLKLGEKHRL